MPQISAFAASAGTNPDDLFSMNSFLSSPFLQGTSLANMTVDGVQLPPARHRWSAYQATRQATTADGHTNVTVAMRLAFESSVVLWRVELSAASSTSTRLTTTARRHELQLQLTPLIRRATALPWVPKYPNSSAQFHFRLLGRHRNGGTGDAFLLTSDNLTAAQSAFACVSGGGSSRRPAGAAQWSAGPSGGKVRLSVAVGGDGGSQAATSSPTILRFVLVVGNSSWPATTGSGGVVAVLRQLSTLRGWTTAWAEAETKWSERWRQAFTPNNAHYSGHLPTLRTPSASFSRIYYNSLLTVVSLERTNLPLVAERVYLTAAGNSLPYDCATCLPHISGMLEVGAAASYYWDVKQMAHIMSLLDPAAFRSYLTFVLRLPPVGGKPGFAVSNGVDLYSGGLFGAWYAFNSFALFSSLHAYLATTGDSHFARTVIGGRSVSQWMAFLAGRWRSFALTDVEPPEPYLADYGGFAGDFLECVRDYTNAVPALQAANAYMLRRTAELSESGWLRGGGTRAQQQQQHRAAVAADHAPMQLRREAAAIVNATLRRSTVDGWRGEWWRCLGMPEWYIRLSGCCSIHRGFPGDWEPADFGRWSGRRGGEASPARATGNGGLFRP
jgi:hypothetical protein